MDSTALLRWHSSRLGRSVALKSHGREDPSNGILEITQQGAPTQPGGVVREISNNERNYENNQTQIH
jgi:hypothetical protein